MQFWKVGLLQKSNSVYSQRSPSNTAINNVQLKIILQVKYLTPPTT